LHGGHGEFKRREEESTNYTNEHELKRCFECQALLRYQNIKKYGIVIFIEVFMRKYICVFILVLIVGSSYSEEWKLSNIEYFDRNENYFSPDAVCAASPIRS